jgi:predicted RNase H-like nuclease (RuvC/YqgF family)
LRAAFFIALKGRYKRVEETDLKHLENDLIEMKSDIKLLEKELDSHKERTLLEFDGLKGITIRHDEKISSLERTLETISENTQWIKRKITGAFITAVITGIVGGAIAIFYAVLQR